MGCGPAFIAGSAQLARCLPTTTSKMVARILPWSDLTYDGAERSKFLISSGA